MESNCCKRVKKKDMWRYLGCFGLGALTGTLAALAADQPQWGQAWTRNLTSSETGLPASFNPQTGENVRWTAKLGTETHSTPIIAKGKVYIGTNNGDPRDPKHKGDRGVLMCFEEATGKLLWQLVVPKRTEDIYFDWPNSGMSSPATVDGDLVYMVSNRGEVMCLDPEGLSNGNGGPFQDEGRHMTPAEEPALATGPLDADILWLFDLTAGAGIWSHDAAHSPILVRGPHLYLNTGTGVDNTHRKIRTPDAPSLIVLDKATGRLLAREREGIAPNIFHSTWAPPSMAVVNGRELIFFEAGNGIVYGFEPIPTNTVSADVLTLKKVFQYDFDPTSPKEEVHRFTTNKRESPSNFYGLPVFVDNHLYIAGGGDNWWGKNEAWAKCIDVTQTGDVTKTAEKWSYPLGKHTFSTVAVWNNLAFIADVSRNVHCLDARTGKPHWTHELKGEIWSSTMIADGKVYIGTRRGDFWVFAASAEKKILSTLELGEPISSTVTVANGVVYVATMSQLYALQEGKNLK